MTRPVWRGYRTPRVHGQHQGLDLGAPQSQTLVEMQDRFRQSPATIDAFLQEHDIPLAEPPFYTFFFRGDADSVRLRHWVSGLETSSEFRRVPGTDLWEYTLELPDRSRVEYKIEVWRQGQRQWVEDPLNPNRARDPFGANSVVQARGYETPDWTKPIEGVPSGSIDELLIESKHLSRPRRISVYQPCNLPSYRRHPLLLVHDGGDYVNYASLHHVLDNLIHRLEIPPLVVVLLHPGNRSTEYAADPNHARFILEEVLPRVETDYPVLTDPESRGLMGASLGAVASFHIALSKSGAFGKLLLQSGSFAFTDIGSHSHGPIFDRVVPMMNAWRENPTCVAEKAFISVGVYEGLVSENRALIPVLNDAGVDVRFVESRDGHNWENWRNRLREGLSWLFPGPLWMIYE